jgi:hypothetical protein
MIPQVEELLSESFFHPETGPAAAGQVPFPPIMLKHDGLVGFPGFP